MFSGDCEGVLWVNSNCVFPIMKCEIKDFIDMGDNSACIIKKIMTNKDASLTMLQVSDGRGGITILGLDTRILQLRSKEIFEITKIIPMMQELEGFIQRKLV